MNFIVPALVLVASAFCFWKARAVGRRLKQFDGGSLQRGMSDMSGDARAYPFFVRLVALTWGSLALAALVAQVLKQI